MASRMFDRLTISFLFIHNETRVRKLSRWFPCCVSLDQVAFVGGRNPTVSLFSF